MSALVPQRLPSGKGQLHVAGFMGSGKSTVGQRVARMLVWNFLDLDGVIERHAGKSIQEIFEEVGEEGFREVEEHVLRQAVQKPRTVVALGGGTLLGGENRRLCATTADVVWLNCPLGLIRERLGGEPGERPLWGGSAELAALFEERLAGYRRAAFEVDASDNPKAVARAVLRAVGAAAEPT